MRISVIIPFKEGEGYLRDCLDSLSEQQFTDYEVLLVLDGYEGDVSQITADYSAKIDIKVFNTENGRRGVAAARNIGLEHAQGEYVYFLDADDYIFDEALSVLLEAADETNEDIVYGKKHFTYYKRKVFLPVYIEKRNALIAEKMAAEAAEKEDTQDDNDETSEGESDDMREGTDEIGSDLVDSTQEAEQELKELAHRNRARKKAIKRLFTRKKKFRSVSILHMIIRRSLIEEMHLRFDENVKYYSDAPFLAALLDRDVNIRKRSHSHYIKRRHADPITQPALSQITDPERFNEMAGVFEAIMEASNPEGSVRRAIDHQVIVYYTDLFIVQMKRNKHDYWRTTRFEKMKAIAEKLLPENIRREKRYRRKMVRLLLKGDAGKSIALITRRLAKKKFIRIFKKKNVVNKYLYTEKYTKKPILEDTIMFETFFGKGYSDSPKYIYEYIAKNFPGKYRFVWVLNEKQKLPYGGTVVKRFSRKYMYYLATSKYFVFNVRQPVWFRKRPGMVFFETWHGTPLKRLAFDLDEVFGASPDYKKQIYKQSRAWDYLLAPNKFSSDIFRRCFKFEKTMCECGYPRNDILHAPDRDAIAARIKEKLNISGDKKVILYAPTWRDDEFFGHGQYKFELKLDLGRMKQRLGSDYVVLLRTHYFIANAIDTSAYGDFTRNVCKYDDISELYLISDIIITDYSSVFFDYANLKRPMLFYTYDLEKYRDVLHGFYMDMETELPGPMLFTTDEVIDSIIDIDTVKTKYADKYEEFYDKYCGWEDGKCAQKCVEELFSNNSCLNKT